MTYGSTGESLRVPDDYAQEYLSVNANVSLEPSTVSRYDSTLTEYVEFLHNNDKTVLTAEFPDVIEFVEDCVRSGNRQSTISSKVSTIAELYRYIRLRTDAGEELRLDPIQFREIDLNQYNVPQPIEREALSKEEIRRLFDSFESYRNRLMAIVGVETGLRNSDIRNLRTEDVQSDQLHIYDPKNSKPYDVPISDQLSFEFDVWFKHHRPGFALASDSEFVFPSQTGTRLASNSSLNTIIKTAAERAGIQDVIGTSQLSESAQERLDTDKNRCEWKRVTVYTLRHSFITLLEEAGVNLSYRQLVANHSNPSTTLNYSHGGSQFDAIRDQYDPPR
ncbi:tyrosine-type recombinase/integrase [Halobellus marinus]|uniref:tyrosine-type recombinase/integrase n=1 Tax=Halobellus TaxID=1073986 RepID=UPI0028A730DB|nr:site-specific integrase [Halobellus sp. DFY28]